MCSPKIYDTLNSLAVWERMSTITLEEMRSVKLMNRIDTKYILRYDEALTLLERAADAGYRVQQIDGLRATRYDTLYYDTPERQMYLVHHNQQLTRQKIRTRRYVESGLTFLEVKNKTNRGRTKKQRIEISHDEFYAFTANTQALDFFAERSAYSHTAISPAAATRFVRITLVNATLNERSTIDLDLRYEDVRRGHSVAIDGMVILEVKQDGLARSTMKDILRDMRIPPLKVSKYCLATALTVDDIKKNRYKLKLRDIEKRLGGLTIITEN